jgi:hypothetical protein
MHKQSGRCGQEQYAVTCHGPSPPDANIPAYLRPSNESLRLSRRGGSGETSICPAASQAEARRQESNLKMTRGLQRPPRPPHRASRDKATTHPKAAHLVRGQKTARALSAETVLRDDAVCCRPRARQTFGKCEQRREKRQRAIGLGGRGVPILVQPLEYPPASRPQLCDSPMRGR